MMVNQMGFNINIWKEILTLINQFQNALVSFLFSIIPKMKIIFSFRGRFFFKEFYSYYICIIGLGEFNCLLNYPRYTCGKLLTEGLCTPENS